MASKRGTKTPKGGGIEARGYDHPEAKTPLRPDVGTQPQFKKKKPPATYRYDPSLAPSLDWDGQNPTREAGEALIQKIRAAKSLDEARAAAAELARMSRPFLDWAGKAERTSFDVPTLPLFVHERLSTKAILETLRGHRRERQQSLFDLFGDPQRPIKDQVLGAYEYQDDWQNRMILGDSLVVMSSLLGYEGLGGQVQMQLAVWRWSRRKVTRVAATGPNITQRMRKRWYRLTSCDMPSLPLTLVHYLPTAMAVTPTIGS